jgi:hypothetical protein
MKDHGPTRLGEYSHAAVLCEATTLAADAASHTAPAVGSARPRVPARQLALRSPARVMARLAAAADWLAPRPATRSAIAAACATLFIEVVLHVFR